MSGLARFPKRDVVAPRLGGSTITSATGYPWVDGDILYADDLNAAFLPLSTGGTVLGPTTIDVDATAFPPYTATTSLLAKLKASGPKPGFGLAGQTTIYSDAGTNSTDRFNNPGISFWSTVIKNMPPGGVLPAGTTQLQDQWAYISNNIDASNKPSSIGGAVLNEYDINANGFCDGALTSSPRCGAVYSFAPTWPVGPPPPPVPAYGPTPLTGGWPPGFSSAMSFGVYSVDVCVHLGIAMAIQYSTALWDSRSAVLHSGTIQNTAPAGSTTIHVSNVVGYAAWGMFSGPVSSSNPMPVTIGANTYSVIGAAFDAPGTGGVTTTLGTITLSSGIIGTDGASGNAVTQHARAMWLANGQQVALSGSGAAYIMADNSDGIQIYSPLTVNINSDLGVAHDVEIANALTVLGAATFNANITAAGNAFIGGITFGALPVNAANDAAAATAGVPVRAVYRNGSVLMVRVV